MSRPEGEGPHRAAAALPFLDAVAAQVARHGGEERAAGERALALLRDPDAPDAPARLVAEPPMLAAFFQNVDLLYLHHDPRADRVAGLVMRALELLEPPA